MGLIGAGIMIGFVVADESDGTTGLALLAAGLAGTGGAATGDFAAIFSDGRAGAGGAAVFVPLLAWEAVFSITGEALATGFAGVGGLVPLVAG
jgi:hypothetical protein